MYTVSVYVAYLEGKATSDTLLSVKFHRKTVGSFAKVVIRNA